jgi:hypothetical protein
MPRIYNILVDVHAGGRKWVNICMQKCVYESSISTCAYLIHFILKAKPIFEVCSQGGRKEKVCGRCSQAGICG